MKGAGRRELYCLYKLDGRIRGTNNIFVTSHSFALIMAQIVYRLDTLYHIEVFFNILLIRFFWRFTFLFKDNFNFLLMLIYIFHLK